MTPTSGRLRFMNKAVGTPSQHTARAFFWWSAISWVGGSAAAQSELDSKPPSNKPLQRTRNSPFQLTRCAVWRHTARQGRPRSALFLAAERRSVSQQLKPQRTPADFVGMESLSSSAAFMLLILAVPVGFGLLVLPIALALKKFGPALHRAAEVEMEGHGSPSLWARPTTREQARRACQQAAWLPFVIAALSTVQVAFGGAPVYALVDAAILIACGFGLRRCSRASAALALLLYTANAIISIASAGFFNPLALIYIAGLSYGAYVAFAFHRLPAATPYEVAAG